MEKDGIIISKEDRKLIANQANISVEKAWADS